jgi:putative heme-binding domain-containing protein
MGLGRLFGSSAAVTQLPGESRQHKFEPLDDSLLSLIQDRWQEDRDQSVRLRLAIRAGIEDAEAHLLTRLAQGHDTAGLLAILAELGRPNCVMVVLPLVDPTRPIALQQAALEVLARFVTPEVTATLLRQYDRLTPAVRSRARDVLFSKRESARAFLARVDAKQIAATDVPLEQVRRLALIEDPQIEVLVRKHWGKVTPGTPEEKLADMRRFANDLRAGAGDRDRGKELFKQHCASCHRLFGEGGTLGPDLTGFARSDTEALLASLVDPSAVIRKEFLSQVVTTRRGTIHTGLVVEQDGSSLTLADAQNNRTRVRRDDIEEKHPSPTSLMPERLLDTLTPQQRRDLFRYLQGNQP